MMESARKVHGKCKEGSAKVQRRFPLIELEKQSETKEDEMPRNACTRKGEGVVSQRRRVHMEAA